MHATQGCPRHSSSFYIAAALFVICHLSRPHVELYAHHGHAGSGALCRNSRYVHMPMMISILRFRPIMQNDIIAVTDQSRGPGSGARPAEDRSTYILRTNRADEC